MPPTESSRLQPQDIDHTITATHACKYLVRYAARYRSEYDRFTQSPPEGGGYPRLATSPFVTGVRIECHIAIDGFVIVDESDEPPYQWYVAGGPALLVDEEPTRTPTWVRAVLEENSLLGKPIGIYRIVAKERLPGHVWRGDFPDALDIAETCVGSQVFAVRSYDIRLTDLIARLTFGAFGILDLHLADSSGPFWTPHQVRRLGISTADREHRRWINTLEIFPHVCPAAWDERAIPTRVNVDLRRDFQHAIASLEQAGGSLSVRQDTPLDLVRGVRDRLARLTSATEEFQRLLESQGTDSESVFHAFLARHPILLDVYATAFSKPRFIYPPGGSPFGKQYVEPDFILKYPHGRYRLVELERPSKNISTVRGPATKEVTQAAFQIAEWVDYIGHHYHCIADKFPGISSSPETMIVIGRAGEKRPSDMPLDRYLAFLRHQYGVDEVLTYDDLLLRAYAAAAQIAGIL